MNLRCWLFGCDYVGDYLGWCSRCDTEAGSGYGGPIWRRLLRWVVHISWVIARGRKWLFGWKCEICGRRIRFKMPRPYCSYKCYSSWSTTQRQRQEKSPTIR
jgi:hypothetical protein